MSKSQTVLVIDDDELIQRLVRARLARLDAEIVGAESGAAGLVAAQERLPDLILLDVSLPDLDGFAVCHELRSDPLTSDIPIIFLTGSDDRNEITRGFDLGAVDYVTKPFNADEVYARVRAALRTQALVTALERQARTDSLTGLSNRDAFRTAVVRAIERLRRFQDYRFAILFFDLDRFKIINDSLGHAIGDELLVTVANRLHRSVRGSRRRGSRGGAEDMVARMGGDEFAILLDDIGDAHTACRVAERILRELQEPCLLHGYEVTTGASIGVKIASSPEETADDLLRDSDTAMYQAKSAGKGQVLVFDTRMHQQAIDRLECENDLARALGRDEFELLFQPIVELDTGALVGFEALLRWNHPERGMVMPEVFIPILEETGRIVQVGRWALRDACRRMREWHLKYAPERLPMLSVNLSKVQLKIPTLPEEVRAVLVETGLDPEHLKLEVTESVIMHDARSIVPMLESLRAVGVQLAMDDFGTGYSSLGSLQRFPIDLLKIDRSFVQCMSESRMHSAIVHTIVTLAEQLDIPVVAEGVETEDHLVQLQAMDCSLAQGYYFSRPLRADAVEKLLADGGSLAGRASAA